ncbi:hypothetical protein [Glycomyces rhizosphaerae]|uniref:Uncharacterized protein n=1 Tax=Glycomyces rhizosphaerae TaxID=2054422 RepID=A0ABV7PWC4_9ACTN
MELLATDDPCAFLDMDGASGVLFGDSLAEGQTEEINETNVGCSDRLSIMHDGEETGSLEVVSRVFVQSDSEDTSDSDEAPSSGQIEWFYPEGQEELNEVIESSVTPVSDTWNAGDAYLLDGIFRNRDLYIVGAWGEVNGFEYGIAFKVTAEQEYFDQPLLYNQYCDATNLNSGCIISSDVLYQWMTAEYLPTILEKLDKK